jgi:hypothetical protein
MWGFERDNLHPENTPCHVIKENEAKRKNSLTWGGGYKMATKAILPPSQVADSGPES